MAKQHPDYIAADAAAALRADLIRVAQRTAEVMLAIATTYTKAAATYRRMAPHRGDGGLRFHQHAKRLDQRAARARRLAEGECQQINQGPPSEVAKPAGQTGHQAAAPWPLPTQPRRPPPSSQLGASAALGPARHSPWKVYSATYRLCWPCPVKTCPVVGTQGRRCRHLCN